MKYKIELVDIELIKVGDTIICKDDKMHKNITINIEVLVQLCYYKYSVNNENTIKRRI